MKLTSLIKTVVITSFLFLIDSAAFAQFSHPGITLKKSDLDRIKYQIDAKIEPWYSSYQTMLADSKSSYNYTVLGKSTFTEVGRDNGVNYGAWNSDIRAAYYNALQWYITKDTRHAEKAIEIFKAWSNITDVTSNGTNSLSGGVGYIMIEAAEIIKGTYSGWAAADIKKFGDMLVYPGYSTTTAPSGGSFYWMAYQGDAGRHGNQGLSGWRTVMAMGIFLDNQIMYDRALRYMQGLPARTDDIPYPSQVNKSVAITASDDYADTYSTTKLNNTPNYGFNDQINNYIWPNGQCQESSRDQQHVMFGMGLLISMSEMAWNQGTNLYGHNNSRLLKGLEYNMRYNISSIQTYPDQPSAWIPTVASSEFVVGFDRTGRWYSKAISPIGIGGIDVRPVFEMAVGHYLDRGLNTTTETKWLTRTRDKSIETSGYEKAGWSNDAIGWGALTARRVQDCKGDPISGFTNTLPTYAMNVLPMTIEAENFDYSPINGNGRTYFDDGAGNRGNQYRTTEDADIDICTEGGYNLGWLTPGEWYTYTVYVPETKTYDIAVRYSANNNNGKIKFSFGGADKTSEVTLVSTAGWQNWQSQTIAQGVLLSKGVQSLRVFIAGTGTSFNLNNFTISNSTFCAAPDVEATNSASNLKAGLAYDYYEGTWTTLPNFNALTSLQSGTSATVKIGNTTEPANFGYDFKGYIQIKTEGTYTFYTSSDDGSSLSISGAKIVNNDGKHGVVEASGSICLQKGYHPINVNYFNGGGGKALSASYSGPNITKKTLADLYYLPDGIVLGEEDIKELEALFEVYPVPVSSTLTIQSSSAINGIVELFDNSGKLIFTKVLDGDKTLDLSDLSKGIYVLKFTNEEGTIVKKIIKN